MAGLLKGSKENKDFAFKEPIIGRITAKNSYTLILKQKCIKNML